MNGFRPDAHVAQQSRRDKLRVQSGLFQVRDADSCEPAMFSSPATAAAAAEFAAGCQVPLIAPSSSIIYSGESAAAIHPQPGYALAPPQSSLVTYSHLYSHQPKPGFAGYHVDASTDLHFVPQAAVANQGRELQSVIGQPLCSWAVDGGGSEMLLLPSYAADPPAAVLLARQIPPEWSADGYFMSAKCDDAADVGNDRRAARGLSLTLASSSVPDVGMAAPLEIGPSGAYPKFMFNDRSFGGGGSLQDIVSSPTDAAARRAGAGPLGPFTGYATILRNSRFLRPAQQLLDEFCRVVTGSKLAKRSYAGEASRGATSGGLDAVAAGEKESSSRCGNSGGASTSSLHSSAEAGVDQGGAGGSTSGASKIHLPEFQQKKAKLLHMQEEVCRRYKQYHQQMQMVVSSFESVAGLNSATPYSSRALKAISKHFRSLKNAISDQIRHISRFLGEELMASPSCGRRESTMTPRLKYLDQTLRKQKAGEGTLRLSFVENNQPVWRPQRGLPERAVSVLRAWLFEHFLHPYPTDTDKHMLATQTGLSRNQVSNWFINARVRLWKPMIEEIHMLETKGMSGMDLNSGNNCSSRPAAVDVAGSGGDRRFQSQCNEPLDCPSMEPAAALAAESSRNLEPWQGDKRSRVEGCEMLTSMDAGLMSFATYQHAMDIGGIEAVSLTLGLRHDGGHENPQQMRHLGTQMFHDLVG